MKLVTDTNNTSHKTIRNSKVKILTVNVNGLNNINKRTKTFNFFKTNKIDITLLQETHSTNITEKQRQKAWSGISFRNSGPTHETAGQATLLKENSEGKIQNIKNDYTGRISSNAFNLYKQTFQILNIYRPNKPY